MPIKKKIQTTDSWPGYQFEISSVIWHGGYTVNILKNSNFPEVKDSADEALPLQHGKYKKAEVPMGCTHTRNTVHHLSPLNPVIIFLGWTFAHFFFNSSWTLQRINYTLVTLNLRTDWR